MPINPNGLYCAYLRKSRRDEELEALGHGETLARHERQLSELAARLGVRIAQTYREIVSGDTIAQRPQIQRLLADVSAGLWDGVFAVDVDRFGRGDSIDQGIIMQTFMYSDVLIITPDKIYDPSSDSDAEFFEIKLFFSRREYSMIKKRMLRGRLASVMDGCYMGSRPVYGYERVKLQGRKGWTLRIVPEKADVVRAVFDWYAHGMDGRDVGAAVIADRLNAMGLRTDMGNPFEASYIRHMLQNPAYIGKVQWNQKTTIYRIEDGRRVSSRQPGDGAILTDGLHDPIIDRPLWDEVQQLFAAHAKRPKNMMAEISNPLAGLIYCSQCGRAMQLRPDPTRRDSSIRCVTPHCPTCATYLGVVEDAILRAVAGWVTAYDAELAAGGADRHRTAHAAAAAALQQHQQTLDGLRAQSDRLYDLLEQGVYSVAEYRQRRDDLNRRMDETAAAIRQLTAAPAPDYREKLIPRARNVLAAYRDADPAGKNQLLRNIISRVTYTKTRRCYRNNNPGDYLTLQITPLYPTDDDI